MPFLEADEEIKKKIKGKEYTNERLKKIIALEKERITKFSDLPVAVKFIFMSGEYDTELLVWKKSDKNGAKKSLEDVLDFLNNFSVQAWKKDRIEKETGEWIGKKGLTNREVLWPLRVALSGQKNSPGPFEIMEVLGKDETINRVKTAIQKLSVNA